MTDKQRRQTGKFLLIAQIPIFLFSIFIFSQFNKGDDLAMDGQASSEQYPNGKLNLDLPEPKREKPMDKFSLIEKAAKDSLELSKKNRAGDEFLKSLESGDIPDNDSRGVAGLQQKLGTLTEQLEKEEKRSQQGSRTYGNPYSYEDFEKEQRRRNEMKKLDRLTDDMVASGDTVAGGELADVNQTMDKLVNVMQMASAIENGKPLPGEESTAKEETVVYTVVKPKGEFLDINTEGFNEIDEGGGFNMDNSFKASFFNQQTLTSGETVKIKLDEPMQINEILIPANNFLYGKANIVNDRLTIKISSIRYEDYLFPVSLTVYDYDGQDGIHIPGSLTREKGKRSASSSIRGMDFGVGGFDESVKTRALTTGSNFIKDLFAAKVKQIKITVRPYHKILIKNN